MERRVDQAGPNTRYIEQVHRQIGDALIGGARSDYELGRLIDEVIVGHYWSRRDYPGAPEGGWPDSTAGFKEWCWTILGFKHRKAYYLRNIYLGLTAMNLNEKGLTFARALRQGWCKVVLILREARTKERLIYWLERCENWWCPECGKVGSEGECDCGAVMSRPLTENALKAEIAMALGGDDGDEDGDTGDGDTGTEDPPTKISKKTTRVEFPLTFENEDAMRLFIKAIDIIKSRTNTDSNGEAAARMASAYFATCPHDDEGGLVMEIEQMIRIMEDAWGVRLQVVSDAEPAMASDTALEGFGD